MDYEKAERLAALLDGTCSAEEREALLALLAEDDDDLEVFAAAGAALSQHEQEERDAGVIRLRPAAAVPATAPAPRLRPPRRWVALAAAAGIAAVLMIGVLRRPAPSGPAGLVAQLHEPGRRLSAGVTLTSEPMRGTPVQRRLSEGEHVRLGVWLVVLEVAARSGDQANVRAAAAHVADLLERTPDHTLAGEYRSISRDPPRPGRLDPELGGQAEKVAGQATVTRLGEWLQVARIAADAQDTAFFLTRESRAWLAGKGVPESMEATAGPWLQQAWAAVNKRPTPDWTSLDGSLGLLLETLAR